MINQNDIINKIKDTFLSFFADDLKKELTIYSEKAINPKSKIRITLKFNSANTTMGITDLPAQFIVEANDDVAQATLDALLDFATTQNENSDTITKNNVVYSYKEFYSTPTVIGNFQSNGIDYYSLMVVDCRYVLFVDALLSNDATIKIGTTSDGKVSFNGCLSINYGVVNTMDSFVEGLTSPTSKNYVNGSKKQLYLEYIYNPSNTMMVAIATDQLRNNLYVEYKVGTLTRNLRLSLASYNDTVLFGDVIKCNIALLDGDA